MAITITKVEVIAIAAEFAGARLTDAQWDTVLLLTNEQMNVAAFPSQVKADIAARYLAAHIASGLTTTTAPGSGVGGAAGPLASVSVGSVSKTFRTGGNVDSVSSIGAAFMSTSYGREYLRLVRTWCPRIVLAQGSAYPPKY